jgi:hypothetical protein
MSQGDQHVKPCGYNCPCNLGRREWTECPRCATLRRPPNATACACALCLERHYLGMLGEYPWIQAPLPAMIAAIATVTALLLIWGRCG